MTDERPYSKREMDQKLGEVTNLININHKETLDKVTEVGDDVKNMNVEIKNHSEDISSLKAFRYGANIAITFFVVVVVPLMLYIWNSKLTQDQKNNEELKALIISHE